MARCHWHVTCSAREVSCGLPPWDPFTPFKDRLLLTPPHPTPQTHTNQLPSLSSLSSTSKPLDMLTHRHQWQWVELKKKKKKIIIIDYIYTYKNNNKKNPNKTDEEISLVVHSTEQVSNLFRVLRKSRDVNMFIECGEANQWLDTLTHLNRRWAND